MIGIFVLGYIGIIFEEVFEFNKAAVALLMSTGLWVTYADFYGGLDSINEPFLIDCVPRDTQPDSIHTTNLCPLRKEIVHFRFCRQENLERSFQRRIHVFLKKKLQKWFNLII